MIISLKLKATILHIKDAPTYLVALTEYTTYNVRSHFRTQPCLQKKDGVQEYFSQVNHGLLLYAEC